MRIRPSYTLLPLALVALGLCATANADSTYGYSTAGTGSVTATAKVNISIVVPKVVLLRVGSASTTQDTLNFAAQVTVQPTPTTVTGTSTGTTASSAAINWDGTAPTVTVPTNTQSAAVYAWTNGSAVKLGCSATPLAAGGPSLADIAVAGTGALTHPGTDLTGCGVAQTALTANTLYNDTWTYTLNGTPSSWAAGAYSTAVTYTATGT